METGSNANNKCQMSARTFWHALENGDIPTVKLALKQGLSPDTLNEQSALSPLMWLVIHPNHYRINNWIKLVKTLISYDANINFRYKNNQHSEFCIIGRLAITISNSILLQQNLQINNMALNEKYFEILILLCKQPETDLNITVDDIPLLDAVINNIKFEQELNYDE